MKSKVILGTAKFGTNNYGFSSKEPRLSFTRMLQLANNLGIVTLDTSPRYGLAEKMIGQFHKDSKNIFKVSTKVDNLEPASKRSGYEIKKSVLNSINVLNVRSIETLYLHQNEIDIISDKNIIDALAKVKSDGYVKKIGVSVYNIEECNFALRSQIYDVIQLPVSILDSHIYSQINNLGLSKEIVARSIFLQGILFNRTNINQQIKQSEDLSLYLRTLDEISYKHKYSLVDLAVAFVAGLSMVDNLIVGTSSEKNLEDISKASKIKLPNDLNNHLKDHSSRYKIWGNPRNWN
jgi:aryl-alcohol dehydrogenase-like predicted oxidoreductase